VRALNLLVAVLTAVTVTISMRAVGLLLVSALMVVPVATAQQVARGFVATMGLAMVLGVAAAGSGVWLAWEIDTALGATIVILAIAGFLIVAVAVAATRAVRKRAALRSGRPDRGSGRPVPADAEPHEVVLDRS
jgi:zinc transport system permease protein